MMVDDALTRKEAEMGRLLPCPFCGYEAELRKQYSALEGDPKHYVRCSNGKCGARYVPGGFPIAEWNDHALSLESMREEALEEAAKVCEKLKYHRRETADAYLKACDSANWEGHKLAQLRCAEAIRALQHAPARAAEGGTVREALSNLVSLLLQTMEPIGPMRSRKDYPPELQTAINVLRAAPESPAKEQPGEQNAAPQASAKPMEPLVMPFEVGPAAAAPDVVEMVKRFKRYAESAQKTADTAIDDRDRSWAQGRATAYRRCAKDVALIEKLGQGWIPALESESKGVFLTGIPGKSIYAVDERAEPYCWWRFDLPALPPPTGAPMTDALADEIATGRLHLRSETGQSRFLSGEEEQQIIAALRRSKPRCSMGYACGDFNCQVHHPRQPSSDQVLVPREPTDMIVWAICEHGESVRERCNRCPREIHIPGFDTGVQGCRAIAEEQYAAMLAAAEAERKT